MVSGLLALFMSVAGAGAAVAAICGGAGKSGNGSKKNDPQAANKDKAPVEQTPLPEQQPLSQMPYHISDQGQDHGSHQMPEPEEPPAPVQKPAKKPAKKPPVQEHDDHKAPEPEPEQPVQQKPLPPVEPQPLPPVQEHSGHDDHGDDDHAGPETGEEGGTSGPCPKTGDAVCSCNCETDDKTDDGAAHDHDHHDAVALPPPGADASRADIRAYLEALSVMEDSHSHDMGSGKAGEHMAAMDLVPRAEATHVAIDSGDWFNPKNWSTGRVPGDDARVLVPEGVHMHYGGVSDARLFTVRVDGELSFATDTDSQMIFDTMVVTPSGRLEIGTADTPVHPDVEVNLIVANNGPIDTDWDPMLLSRGIVAHGETSIFGAVKDSHEKVIDDPMAGDKFLSFAEAPEGWQVGDTIVVAGTRYEGYKHSIEEGEKIHYAPEDEVRMITAIEDNRIYFNEALEFDHDTPRADLKTSVANYTRNVSIETEGGLDAEVYERGHVMFMHSDEVDVRYAEFLHLGRTDKSVESFDINNIDDVRFDSNVQGRYSLHLHRTGTSDLDDPAVVVGNAVYGSPGWGYVHHDSNAVLENNASYDTFGAGFVAETGNETGTWSDNIAIYAQGVSWADPKNSTKLSADQFDTAVGGDGFWFQGRLVSSFDNVAASVNTGFVYFHREGASDRMIDIPSENFAYEDALMRTSVSADDTPILSFSGNETFASKECLHVVKSNPAQGHDVWSHLDDFTAWSVQSGVHLQYTSHYLLTDFDLIATDDERFSLSREGIYMGNSTSEIVVVDAKIDGFRTGIDLHKEWRGGLEGTPDSQHNYTIINPTFSNVGVEYANYDPRLDTVLDEAPDINTAPDLQLDKMVFGNTPEERTVHLNGTKTDSLGTNDFPGGTDRFHIAFDKVVEQLEETGYWTTSSGQAYTLTDIYFTDRLTGQIYYETHPLYINDDVPLGSESRSGGYFADTKNNGVQNIEKIGDTRYAGDVLLDTAIPVDPVAPISIPETTPGAGSTHGTAMHEMSTGTELMKLLAEDQGSFDETMPDMAEDEDPEQMEMAA